MNNFDYLNVVINNLIQIIQDVHTSEWTCYACNSRLELIQDSTDTSLNTYFNCNKCLNKIGHENYTKYYKPINYIM